MHPMVIWEGWKVWFHFDCGNPKENRKILPCNLEASLFSFLRSFPSGPQGVLQDPIDLPDVSDERHPSECRPTEI